MNTAATGTERPPQSLEPTPPLLPVALQGHRLTTPNVHAEGDTAGVSPLLSDTLGDPPERQNVTFVPVAQRKPDTPLGCDRDRQALRSLTALTLPPAFCAYRPSFLRECFLSLPRRGTTPQASPLCLECPLQGAQPPRETTSAPRWVRAGETDKGCQGRPGAPSRGGPPPSRERGGGRGALGVPGARGVRDTV